MSNGSARFFRVIATGTLFGSGVIAFLDPPGTADIPRLIMLFGVGIIAAVLSTTTPDD